ncbi:MAG TPA: arsenite methyltransferase [Ignavibacteriales bacterium]|nr:arsenite methyltransferase [Ignavibacteriales bacterium]
MNNDKEIKEVVKEKYGQIASQSEKSSSSCCCGGGSSSELVNISCCGGSSDDVNYTIMSDEYTHLQGYVAEADLNLGCGLPTQFAAIKKGDTVVDLGSGAGNDVFVARSITGENGKVIGIDMTPEMVAKANRNKEKLGFTNVEFYLGEIEEIPLDNDIADVVVSNCVLNLVPDKDKAFSEMFRIIKPGGHFCVSDIVQKCELPEALSRSAAMYAGCVAGALQQEDYLGRIAKAGFTEVEIKKSKIIDLPLETLIRFMPEEKVNNYKSGSKGIFSITVVGYKK